MRKINYPTSGVTTRNHNIYLEIAMISFQTENISIQTEFCLKDKFYKFTFCTYIGTCIIQFDYALLTKLHTRPQYLSLHSMEHRNNS